MKIRVCGLAATIILWGTSLSAQQTLIVDGVERELSDLMAQCQSITNDRVAQVTCFGDVTALLEEQSGGAGPSESTVPVPEALDALKAVAQYEDPDSGLSITGDDCDIQIVYYNNYFHISRRNISTIDLFSAEFDASKFQYDQIVAVNGAQLPLSRSTMDAGETGRARGGVGLDSSQVGFTAKSPRTSLADYAQEVVGQLPVAESQSIDFVLIHPQRSNVHGEIWGAFQTFIAACRQS